MVHGVRRLSEKPVAFPIGLITFVKLYTSRADLCCTSHEPAASAGTS